MSTEFHTQINESFGEFVEETDKLTEYFLDMVEEQKFNRKKVEKEFTAYMSDLGADGDDLKDIVNKGMELLQDVVVPNKSDLYPDSVKPKLKVGDLKKKEASPPTKKKFSMGSIKKKEETESGSDQEDSAESSPNKKKSGAKRASGYTLYYNSVKDEVKEALETEWKEKYPDAPYRSNPAEVSRKCGQMWAKFQEDEPEKAQKFKDDADAQNSANGIVSHAKSKKPENEKKPLTGFQMYHKLKKGEVLDAYRKEHKMKADEKIAPTDAMTIVSESWNEYKKNEDDVAEMNRLAEEYNTEHGRVHVKKEKSDKKSDKKTNAYLEFCSNFREEFRAKKKEDSAELDTYEESKLMNQKWNNEIKADKKKHEAWKQIAKEENISRGFEEKEKKSKK